MELLYDGRTMGFGMNRFLAAVTGYDSSCLLLIGATTADKATVVVGAVVRPPRFLPRWRMSVPCGSSGQLNSHWTPLGEVSGGRRLCGRRRLWREHAAAGRATHPPRTARETVAGCG